ncbi:MAG: hypothetical protein ACI8ZO_000537 [Flavobacteriales bacterium]|jgi:uncharacterized protein YbbC (DUF1343 family)
MQSFIYLISFLLLSCTYKNADLRVGADRFTSEFTLQFKDKRIGFVGNQSSLIGKTHFVDILQDEGLNVVRVFSPEHGFRGKADAGEKIVDGIDLKSGLPVISLYGSNKKPTSQQLEGLDVLIFDIQDVGARFYTYISTLHYVMEACAENNIALWVFDRPNPNGHYVDGPILEIEHKSFVGMHPIPVVHGMTIAEYAQMINGESWLKDSLKCNLKVVTCMNYKHDLFYDLPVKPSPNLPNALSIALYPSLCFFEGTPVSVGRGTDAPFQMYGAPFLEGDYSFVPKPGEGAKTPKLNGERCYGKKFDVLDVEQIRSNSKLELEWLVEAYRKSPVKEKFFSSFFTKLAGTKQLQKQIERGFSAAEIRDTWKKGLEAFSEIRAKYLLYP